MLAQWKHQTMSRLDCAPTFRAFLPFGKNECAVYLQKMPFKIVPLRCIDDY